MNVVRKTTRCWSTDRHLNRRVYPQNIKPWFRILAKVAVRAHMEQQVPGSKTAPDDGGGEEEG